ncbi:type II toxin-antitoxin system VapB family antitoxin [Nocardia sp. NPDC058640]|uniref:type II toxin-antitoxin system VapB family antitoxin n=1 Tax=Nocardia sp. NPDC058640 TaxID=3346571 RepID=UPI003666574E
MSLTHIDIDDELLEQAKQLGGHRTKTATVAAALEEYAARRNRLAAYDRFLELASDMDIEGAEAAHRAAKQQGSRP